MISGWKDFLRILPKQIAAEVEQYRSDEPQELRLRVDRPTILLTANGEKILHSKS